MVASVEVERRGPPFWKRLLGACLCRGVEWARGYLCERSIVRIVPIVSCSGSEQGVLLVAACSSWKLFLVLCPVESAVLTTDQSGLHRAAPVDVGLPPGAENTDPALAATPSFCPQGSSGVLQASNQKVSLSPGRKPEKNA